jgi:hypothetical protein
MLRKTLLSVVLLFVLFLEAEGGTGLKQEVARGHYGWVMVCVFLMLLGFILLSLSTLLYLWTKPSPPKAPSQSFRGRLI